jgi:hypothetical protein
MDENIAFPFIQTKRHEDPRPALGRGSPEAKEQLEESLPLMQSIAAPEGNVAISCVSHCDMQQEQDKHDEIDHLVGKEMWK